jgi:hypothetical protein
MLRGQLPALARAGPSAREHADDDEALINYSREYQRALRMIAKVLYHLGSKIIFYG